MRDVDQLVKDLDNHFYTPQLPIVYGPRPVDRSSSKRNGAPWRSNSAADRSGTVTEYNYGTMGGYFADIAAGLSSVLEMHSRPSDDPNGEHSSSIVMLGSPAKGTIASLDFSSFLSNS